MRIKPRGIDMKSNTNDLAIQWTIHELLKFSETSMKPVDKHMVENINHGHLTLLFNLS